MCHVVKLTSDKERSSNDDDEDIPCTKLSVSLEFTDSEIDSTDLQKSLK